MTVKASRPTVATLFSLPPTEPAEEAKRPQSGSITNSRKQLMRVGLMVISGQVSPKRAYDRALGAFQRHYSPKAALAIAEMVMHTSIRWARSGFPSVVTSHLLAASMMESNVSESSLDEVQLPWPAFLVEIPDNLGVVFRWVVVTTHEEKENTSLLIFGLSDTGEEVIIVMTPLAPTLGQSLKDIVGDLRAEDPVDWTRQEATVARLVLGVCVEMSRKKIREQIRVGPSATDKIAIKRGEPKAWVFKVTRDVHVDARPMVRAYLSGHSGRTIGTQTLVRGHYKRQPYGEKGQLRRWMFIEPYWRGLEDAPVALKSHVIE